jgi:putative membrane protein insertion efficiency factor
MGHCNSSTALGSHGEICGVGRGAAATDSPSFACERSASPAQEGMSGQRPAGRVLLLGLLRFYQIFLSPFFGGACKFYPSCSNYAYEAVNRHGIRRGIVLALKRLGRCRPFTQGGFDPVPEANYPDLPLPPAIISRDGKESLR